MKTNNKQIMDIPNHIKIYFKEHNLGVAELVKRCSGFDVYCPMIERDSTGHILPTGLPIFVIDQKGRITVKDGEEALDFIGTF